MTVRTTTKIVSLLTIAGFLSAMPSAGFAAKHVTMGDGAINGAMIEPYELTWSQCSLQDDEWIDSGSISEEAVIIGGSILRLRQISKRPDGRRGKSTTYFERASFSPLRIEQEITSPAGDVAAMVKRTLNESGYSAEILRNSESSTKTGAVSTREYHGGALGLPLAILDYDDAPFFFEASMIGLDATYKVKATLGGKDSVNFGGHDVEILLVDIEWRHNELGDIYPPGPNASGGRYWIAQNPPQGFPYVLRYKTDTYAIEFLPEACPAPSSTED